MKNINLLQYLLIAMLISTTSCEKRENLGLAAKVEFCRIYMFVTNNKGEDVAFNTEGYWKDGNGRETYRFDEWEVFWDNEPICSSKNNLMEAFRPINKSKTDNPEGKKNIYLDTDLKVQEILDETKEYAMPHTIKYVATSKALFGDNKKHYIEVGFSTSVIHDTELFANITYSISVDGVPQEIFYPHFWNAEPHFEDAEYNFPYFVLNIDQL